LTTLQGRHQGTLLAGTRHLSQYVQGPCVCEHMTVRVCTSKMTRKVFCPTHVRRGGFLQRIETEEPQRSMLRAAVLAACVAGSFAASGSYSYDRCKLESPRTERMLARFVIVSCRFMRPVPEGQAGNMRGA